jgi:hypothetical protein
MMLEQAYQLRLSPVPVLVKYPPTFTTRGYRGSVPGGLSAEVGYDTAIKSFFKLQVY